MFIYKHSSRPSKPALRISLQRLLTQRCSKFSGQWLTSCSMKATTYVSGSFASQCFSVRIRVRYQNYRRNMELLPCPKSRLFTVCTIAWNGAAKMLLFISCNQAICCLTGPTAIISSSSELTPIKQKALCSCCPGTICVGRREKGDYTGAIYFLFSYPISVTGLPTEFVDVVTDHFGVNLTLSIKSWSHASPAIHMKKSVCNWVKSHFVMKGWASRLALRKRLEVIRKWPVLKPLNIDFFLLAVWSVICAERL